MAGQDVLSCWKDWIVCDAASCGGVAWEAAVF